MTKRVLDIGNCAADHASIRALIENNFDAKVIQAHGPEDAFTALRNGQVDLVLVNRKLDRDDTDGLDIIGQIKADAELNATPCMLITNLPDHQNLAVQAGAQMGFGKRELGRPETRERLRAILG